MNRSSPGTRIQECRRGWGAYLGKRTKRHESMEIHPMSKKHEWSSMVGAERDGMRAM